MLFEEVDRQCERGANTPRVAILASRVFFGARRRWFQANESCLRSLRATRYLPDFGTLYLRARCEVPPVLTVFVTLLVRAGAL